MIQISFFGLRGSCVYSARRRAIQLGLLVSVKAGKPAESLLRFSPFAPVQGQVMGMENPVSFSDKFSKLYLVECNGKQPLMKKIFVVDVGRYFYCSTPVQVIGRNAVLAHSNSLKGANRSFL